MDPTKPIDKNITQRIILKGVYNEKFFTEYYMKSLIKVIFPSGNNIPNFDNIACI